MSRALALLLLVAIVAVSTRAWWGGSSGPRWPAGYAVRGIDVSRHQGAIDWHAVAADGIDFAYIKASEGGDWTDPRFADNWAASREAGVVRGGYHFFTFCRDAAEQARHALRSIPDEPGTLPLAVDVEYGGNCRNHGSRAEIREELDHFIAIVTEARGRPPLVYAVHDGYRDFVRGRLPGMELWVQDVFDEPALEGGRAWRVWQHSRRGRVAGIEGDVDLNVFAGSPRELRRWARLD